MDNKPELKILNSSKSRGINRREMVRRLMGGAGLGYAAPALAAAHPMYAHLGDAATVAQADAKRSEANWKPLFLDPHQSDTLAILGERIVPNSSQAQANRFIDLLLSVDTQERQQQFLNSLAAFEAEAIGRYGHPYKDLTEDQQNQILTVASTAKLGAPHEPGIGFRRRGRGKGNPETAALTLRDHFENLKGWVVGAYYSSEIGMKELGWTGQVMFESFPGCEHPEGHH